MEINTTLNKLTSLAILARDESAKAERGHMSNAFHVTRVTLGPRQYLRHRGVFMLC